MFAVSLVCGWYHVVIVGSCCQDKLAFEELLKSAQELNSADMFLIGLLSEPAFKTPPFTPVFADGNQPVLQPTKYTQRLMHPWLGTIYKVNFSFQFRDELVTLQGFCINLFGD